MNLFRLSINLLRRDWRAGEWRVLLIALGTAAAVYVAFELYLSVLLPRGRWTDW